jgi:hypothetical protein
MTEADIANSSAGLAAWLLEFDRRADAAHCP